MHLLVVFLLACTESSVLAQGILRTKDLAALVQQSFGPLAQLASDGKESRFPRYFLLSLNHGDAEDLVIPIHVDKAKGSLDARGIKPISIAGHRSVDASIGEHCLGLAFLHGNGGTKPFKSTAASMVYKCFSEYSKIRAGAQLLTGARVPVHSDAVLLDLESGGQMLIYCDSGKYAAKYVRRGD
ncbi:hypothetical protein [Paucibacter sp. KBW04]|uniref:hypothetical protein n=1 Tax=Paucibacter sp. KBW04 TaxID=2153361 RepID=UPI000F58B83B|nr:hypothetical protein [Paucibacter sp. KBW04]